MVTVPMRAKKDLCVIAYDIADNKRRNRIIKIIEPYGRRVNYSVFECMFTPSQFEKVLLRLEKVVVKDEDSIAIYPLCVNCYARTILIPPRKNGFRTVTVFD